MEVDQAAGYFPAPPPHLPRLTLSHESFAVSCLLALAGAASDAVRVPRPTVALHASSPRSVTSRSCASLCSLWPACRRTSTSKIAPMLGAQQQDPPKRVLFALISDCALPALLPALFSRHRVCEEILVLRCEAFRKLENLKAVAIAYGPKLDIG